MNKSYSNKSIVFLSFIFLFSLFFILMSSPVTAKAGQTSKNVTDNTETTKDELLPAAKLNLKAVSLVKGKEYTLKVYNLTDNQTVIFKSDNEDIVSVDEDGLITGIDFGTAIVTATIKEGNKTISKLSCDVTVGAAAVSVKFTKQEHTLILGKKITLKTILEPFNTVEEAKYFSSDPSVATVSAGGRVTAKSVGTAIIYAILDNKSKLDKCVIYVIEDTDETFEKNTIGNVTNDNSTYNVSNDVGGSINASKE